MSEIRLVSLAIVDEDQRVLMVHRRDHNQWQLPGGRILAGEEPVDATKRHAMEELNIDILLQRFIGKTAFSQGGVEYSSEWYQAEVIRNIPILGDMDAYDQAEYQNVQKYQIRSIGVSPNADNFISAAQNSKIHLAPTIRVQ